MTMPEIRPPRKWDLQAKAKIRRVERAIKQADWDREYGRAIAWGINREYEIKQQALKDQANDAQALWCVAAIILLAAAVGFIIWGVVL